MCGDKCGSAATYREQVCMPLNGKVSMIDRCIHQIIASLNAGGVNTVACCCGHGDQIGSIVLSDGRWFGIFNNKEEWEVADQAISRFRRKKLAKKRKPRKKRAARAIRVN